MSTSWFNNFVRPASNSPEDKHDYHQQCGASEALNVTFHHDIPCFQAEGATPYFTTTPSLYHNRLCDEIQPSFICRFIGLDFSAAMSLGNWPKSAAT
jgi:hypothetical protein